MNYILHMTDACNFRCKYCYETKNPRNLDIDNIKSILDYEVKSNLNKKEDERISSITFFGGEPLLVLDKIEDTISYCKELTNRSGHKFIYVLNTNGSLINKESIEFIKNNNITVCYSIDGNQTANDMNRIYIDGKGTFEIVKKNAIRLLENKVNMVCMLTYTKNTIPYLCDSVKYCFDLGFKTVLAACDYTAKWDDDDLIIFKREFEKLAYLYYTKTKNEDSFYLLPFENKIDSHISKEKSCKEKCHLGMYNVNVGTDGNLYPCMQFVYDEDYIIGNCKDGIDIKKRLELMKREVPEKNICKKCAVNDRCKHTCGCMNKLSTGNASELHPFTCETERIIIKCADEVANKLYNEENAMFMQKKYNPLFSVIDSVCESLIV